RAPNAEKPTARPTMPSRAAMAISIAMPSGDGGGRAQRPFEDFRRLAARDQVTVVDDHRRHRMDAELLPVALALAHFGAVLVGLADRRRALCVEAGLGGGAQEDVARARVLGARVVGRQQRVLELRLRLAR